MGPGSVSAGIHAGLGRSGKGERFRIDKTGQEGVLRESPQPCCPPSPHRALAATSRSRSRVVLRVCSAGHTWAGCPQGPGLIGSRLGGALALIPGIFRSHIPGVRRRATARRLLSSRSVPVPASATEHKRTKIHAGQRIPALACPRTNQRLVFLVFSNQSVLFCPAGAKRFHGGRDASHRRCAQRGASPAPALGGGSWATVPKLVPVLVCVITLQGGPQVLHGVLLRRRDIWLPGR